MERLTLTDRELEVLHDQADGLTVEESGRHLYISAPSVKDHRGRINAKLGALNGANAISLAYLQGILHTTAQPLPPPPPPKQRPKHEQGKPVPKELPESHVTRYTEQCLLLHQVSGLIGMYLADSRRRPTAIEEAKRLLDIGLEAQRYVPCPPVKGQTAEDRHNEYTREQRRLHPERYEKKPKDDTWNPQVKDWLDELADVDIPTVDIRDL